MGEVFERDPLGKAMGGSKKSVKRKAAKENEGPKHEDKSTESHVVDATNVHIFIDLVRALGISEHGYHFKRCLSEDRPSEAEIERNIQLGKQAIIERQKLQAPE